MDHTFLVLVVLFILSVSIRTGYELLKDAGRVDPRNKSLFAFIFMTMCVLWGTWFVLCQIDPSPSVVPDGIRWTGLGLVLCGMLLAVGALVQLRGLENITHLVTTGIYSKLRHPMYVGFICWIIGWSLYHDAVASLVVGGAGIVNILFWRRWEEARLVTQFGGAYEQYRRTTWF